MRTDVIEQGRSVWWTFTEWVSNGRERSVAAQSTFTAPHSFETLMTPSPLIALLTSHLMCRSHPFH